MYALRNLEIVHVISKLARIFTISKKAQRNFEIAWNIHVYIIIGTIVVVVTERLWTDCVSCGMRDG